MLDLVILMLMGKGQDYLGQPWQWALAYTALALLFGGMALPLLLFRFAFSLLYFYLLSRFADKIALWWGIYLLFPVAIFMLAFLRH